MGNSCATSLTTLEMLDAVEARISSMRTRTGGERAPETKEVAAVAPRAELREAGVSTGEFARLAGVPLEALEAWSAGQGAAPEWLSAAIRMIVMLPPSARRKLLRDTSAASVRPAGTAPIHPFSRIEEL